MASCFFNFTLFLLAMPPKNECMSSSLSLKRKLDIEQSSVNSEPQSPIGINDMALFNQLMGLAQEQQAKLVRAIAERLDFGDALHIQFVLERRLSKMPLLDALPRGILIRIVKSLDCRTLINLALCGQKYSEVLYASDNLSCEIWKHISTEADPLTAEGERFMAQNAHNADHLTASDYLSAYYWLYNLRKNWSLNLSRTASMEIPGARTITDLVADWERCRLFMSSDDSLVRIYEFEAGAMRLRGALNGHHGGVWCIQAVGDILITGSTDRSVAVWDVRSMNRLHELIGHGSTVRALLLHGQYVISGSRDGVIRVWEWATGECTYVLVGHSASVRCLGLLIDNDGLDYVVSGSYDETIIIWSLQSGKIIKRLEGHTGRIYALKVHQGFIYSAGTDHRVKKWDPCSGSCIADIFTSQALIGMLEAQGNLIASGSTDGRVCVFDSRTDDILYTIQLEPTNGITPSVSSISLNQSFMLVTSNTAAYLFSSSNGERLSTLLDNASTVWRGVLTECCCYVAYQQGDTTRVFAADFTPR